jgi:type II secretory pathway component PulF
MRKREIASIIISVLLWSVIPVAMVLVVPVFAAMFADFGAQLPAPTQWCIDVSSFTRSHLFLVAVPFAAALIVAAAWTKEKNKKLYFIIFPVSGLFAVLLFVVVLFLPVFQTGSVAK